MQYIRETLKKSLKEWQEWTFRNKTQFWRIILKIRKKSRNREEVLLQVLSSAVLTAKEFKEWTLENDSTINHGE